MPSIRAAFGRIVRQAARSSGSEKAFAPLGCDRRRRSQHRFSIGPCRLAGLDGILRTHGGSGTPTSFVAWRVSLVDENVKRTAHGEMPLNVIAPAS
jgi:hypothetical protein